MTVTIAVNGTPYRQFDPVTWEDAISAEGFYYDRARYLGLPQPMALLFDPNHPDHLEAMGRYHGLFRDAEAGRVTDRDNAMR